MAKGMQMATRAFALGLLNSPIIHRMNHKASNITQNHQNIIVINKINQIILNRIPTVATVFVGSF